MRAVSRFGSLLLAGAIAFAPAVALAQEAPAADTPPSDAVGPQELQNFSLNGTVTRQADQPPPAAKPVPQKHQPQAQAQTASPTPTAQQSVPAATARSEPAPTPAAPPQREVETATREVSPSPQTAASASEPLRQSPPSSSVTVSLPNIGSGTAGSATAAPASAADFAPAPASGTLAPEHGFPFLPWLLAALALALGGAFLFWRNRGREAFAGGPQVDLFTAPEPAPAPAPPRREPVPPPAAPTPAPPAVPAGIVSTRLRPWVDIGFQPVRCVLDDESLVVEFDIELFNSGSAPARGVLVEGSLFNAGPAQDQAIGAFFANPVGEGERIVVLPPLKRATLQTRVSVARNQLQPYELGGHQVFVPVIAFNALYSWSGGEGQTSSSYLLGRDTKGEKMAPFRLDLGPRIFRGVAARLLPSGVRR